MRGLLLRIFSFALSFGLGCAFCLGEAGQPAYRSDGSTASGESRTAAPPRWTLVGAWHACGGSSARFLPFASGEQGCAFFRAPSTLVVVVRVEFRSTEEAAKAFDDARRLGEHAGDFRSVDTGSTPAEATVRFHSDQLVNQRGAPIGGTDHAHLTLDGARIVGVFGGSFDAVLDFAHTPPARMGLVNAGQ